MASSQPISVRRAAPILVSPAETTPRELKPLSDIDDQNGLRVQIPNIEIYHQDPSTVRCHIDPVPVIREAISRALVHYYPFAGRLREVGGSRKLVVDCTGEGVLFVEADADTGLDQLLGGRLHPPFPWIDELLHDVDGSSGIVDCPLVLVQVTRLACGGFVFASRTNHVMCDGPGVVQFLTAVGELARGAAVPTVAPVWRRDEFLCGRDPPKVTRGHHHAYDLSDDGAAGRPLGGDESDRLVNREFVFTRRDISALRNQLPLHLQASSTFDIVASCLWRCWAVAAGHADEDEEVRLLFPVDIRARINPPLPPGYYGNAAATAVAVAAGRQLCQNPSLDYAIELIAKAKSEITEEFVHSLADFLVVNGRPGFQMERTYLISDATKARFDQIDFGWGPPVYGGPPHGAGPERSFLLPLRNSKWEVVLPVCFPSKVAERFAAEIRKSIYLLRTAL